MNFGITFMTFYTEEVQSDSKAFDLYIRRTWLESLLGHWLSSLQLFILVHPGIFGKKSWAKKWACMGKDVEGRSHGLTLILLTWRIW
jgi:hypothetical protein